MDFFDRQDHARRRTGLLVLLFAACVASIIAGIYLVAAGVRMQYALQQVRPGSPEAAAITWWNPGLFAAVLTGVLLVVSGGALYKIHQLAGGGAAVARLLGGRPVAPDTKDFRERRLLNVIEEMAIASGIPVPAVFVLDGERGLNAFAAGYSPRDAAVAVTEGTMTLLNRDELQGVVAHEFSHILNGDMRMNLRLMGILHGILLIGLTGWTILRISASGGRSRGSRRGGPPIQLIAVGAALLVLGYIGVFFGKLIKSAISRQREYLADAAALQFTRNPDGIGGALKKIGGFYKRGRLGVANAEEASHLYIANALNEPLFGWLATHPPLEKRIRAIDPRWDGVWPAVEWPKDAEAEAKTEARKKGLRDALPVLLPAAVGAGGRIAVTPDAVTARVGTLTPEHVSYSAALLASIPEPLTAAARDPVGARALVYALLLDPDPSVRSRQRETAGMDAEASAARAALEPMLAALGPESRLPLIDIALPALRGLDAETLARFRDIVKRLVAADQKTSLFEFALQKILQRHLDRTGADARRPAKYYAIRALVPEAATLLSALAHVGNPDPDRARQAFAVGILRLGLGAQPVAFIPREDWTLDHVSAALDRFAESAPGVKRLILRAGAECIATDGTVTRDEAELLRAIADALDCPMPPFGGGAA